MLGDRLLVVLHDLNRELCLIDGDGIDGTEDPGGLGYAIVVGALDIPTVFVRLALLAYLIGNGRAGGDRLGTFVPQ